VKPLQLAVILPHTLLFGGVKQYVELGNTFVARGHRFIIFSPDGVGPDWYPFSGETLPLSEFEDHKLDVVITSEEMFLDYIVNSKARYKVFYVINKNKALRRIARHKAIIFFANSTQTMRRIRKKTGKTAFKAYCGVNTDDFFPRKHSIPDEPFVVFTYGRQTMKRKGTDLVKKACENLYRKGYNIKLLLFDTITDKKKEEDYRNFNGDMPFEFVINHPVKKNHELFHRAHVFASAERKGTWANTASEAMACGIPVIASKVGSEDFLIHEKTGLLVSHSPRSIEKAIKRLYHDAGLRERLAKAGIGIIRQYQWRITADRILSLFEQSDYNGITE
jgi:glycosyltransferase involved in cell wall biosynthesis